MGEESNVTPEDALQVAQRALQKANENSRLEDRIDELETELTAVKLRLSEIDDERDYADLTLDEKVGMVREHAFRRATDGHGKHAMDYNAIIWEVFDGGPGSKHSYKLMRLAAEAEGFDVVEPSDPSESKKLRVDAAAAKRGPAFFPENKAAGGGVN